MTADELDRALRQLRLGGMATAVSLRAQQARAENLGPIDFLSLLVHDELQKRRDRLLERRIKAAEFRDSRTLDTFDWKFNSLDRALIFELAGGRFIEQREDVLLLGNAGVGKSHIAQAIGMGAIVAGFRVCTGKLTYSSKICCSRARPESAQRPCDVQRDTATDHRRFGNAQTAGKRSRRFARNYHASLRTSFDNLDIEPTDRELAEALRRHAGGCGISRPIDAP